MKLIHTLALPLFVAMSCIAQDIQFEVKATIPVGGVSAYRNPPVAPGGVIVCRYTFDKNALGTPVYHFGDAIAYPVKEFSVELQGFGSIAQRVTSATIYIWSLYDEYNVEAQGYDILGNFTTWTIELEGRGGEFGGSPPLLTSTQNPLTPLDLSLASIKYFLSASYLDQNQNVPAAYYWYSGNITSFLDVPATLGERAADLAKAVVGLPYLWGGKGWNYDANEYVNSTQFGTGYKYWNRDLNQFSIGYGLDCSGLIMWSYNKAAGATKYQAPGNPVNAPGAAGQYQDTTPINETDLQPGDLLFFYNLDSDNAIDHVAMYVGGAPDQNVVEAPYPGRKIRYNSTTALKPFFGTLGGFRRLKGATQAVRVLAHSPVDLIVTDPEGYTISATTFTHAIEEPLTEVPGQLYYCEYAMDAEGDASPMVTAPALKPGDYLIGVTPKPNALATDSYGLDVEVAGATISLAQSTLISNIPVLGYGIHSTGTGIRQFIPVAIEIKPGSSPAPINLGSTGNLPVAILSTATFDATSVLDFATLTLAGGPVAPRPDGALMVSFEDVNGDGLLDLVIHVQTQTLQLTPTSTEAVLAGTTINGVPVKGVGAIRVVPPVSSK